MRAVSVKEIQRLDKVAIEKIGIPSLVLMENAGRSVAAKVLCILKKKIRPSVCVFCGLGNNGGDGFVAARHLRDQGVRVRVVIIGDPRRLKEDAVINYRILKKLKCPARVISRINRAVVSDIAGSDVLVDAIFGVGLNRTISGPCRDLIETLNLSRKKIVAVDIPSGLDGTTGKIYGVCIKAAVTVTFTCLKKGFLKGRGPEHTGRAVIADIGIPQALIKRI